MEKDKIERLMQLQMLENQVNQYGEELKIIDKQIQELGKLKRDVINLESSKETEMISEFSKGIFIKSEIKKELMVDVGSKIFVSKGFEEIKEIIDFQINKFEEVKPKIASHIEKINKELDKIINQRY